MVPLNLKLNSVEGDVVAEWRRSMMRSEVSIS